MAVWQELHDTSLQVKCTRLLMSQYQLTDEAKIKKDKKESVIAQPAQPRKRKLIMPTRKLSL